MVDRQYDLIRRPRLIDEINNTKNSGRIDDNEIHANVEQPSPNTATEAPITDSEVSLI